MNSPRRYPEDKDEKLFTSQITSTHHPSPYLRRFRLPSLNSSPSGSIDDLLSPIDNLSLSNERPNCSDQRPTSTERSKCTDWTIRPHIRDRINLTPTSITNSPNFEAYSRTLKDLAALKQKSRYCSSSDYFSMNGSFSSDNDSDIDDFFGPSNSDGDKSQHPKTPFSARDYKAADALSCEQFLHEIGAQTEALQQRTSEIMQLDRDKKYSKLKRN